MAGHCRRLGPLNQAEELPAPRRPRGMCSLHLFFALTSIDIDVQYPSLCVYIHIYTNINKYIYRYIYIYILDVAYIYNIDMYIIYIYRIYYDIEIHPWTTMWCLFWDHIFAMSAMSHCSLAPGALKLLSVSNFAPQPGCPKKKIVWLTNGFIQ